MGKVKSSIVTAECQWGGRVLWPGLGSRMVRSRGRREGVVRGGISFSSPGHWLVP